MSTDVAQANLLAWYLEDFRRFCALLEISDKGGRRVPFKLNEIQRLYCKNAGQRDVILKARQVGFTTLILALDVYRFLTVRGARVVIVCQSMTGNGPVKTLATTIKRFFACIRKAGISLNFSTETYNEWALKERDASLRIIVAGASEASAVKAGRSGTVTHLHATEVAFWEYADDTLNALLECVPGPEHGSSVLFESTPNGAAGYFYRQCQKAIEGNGGYRLHFYAWHDAKEYSTPLDPGEVIVPANDREALLMSKGVTPEQIKWYRGKVADNGQDRTDQEYPSDQESCFLASGRTFFDQAVNTAMLERAREPLEKLENDRLWIFKRPEPGHGYVIGGDTSEGTGGDDSAAPILDWESGEHVATVLCQLEPRDYGLLLMRTGYLYNTALIAVERNNHGHSVIQTLNHPPPLDDGTPQDAYPAIYVFTDEKQGWPTSPVTRPVMLDDLNDAHRKGYFVTPDRRLLQQIKTFVIGTNGKPAAASGEKDDLVMGGAIAWEVRQRGGWIPPPPANDGVGGYQRAAW